MSVGCAAVAAITAGLAIAACAMLACIPTTSAIAARPNLMECLCTVSPPIRPIDFPANALPERANKVSQW
jgi:hypothetical protein